jgi:acyl-CoA synthetase (AMP-forming)/AMP-acid ligase II
VLQNRSYFFANVGECTTIGGLNNLANQIAHWGIASGVLQKGTVALMMTNCSEFVSIWLGFAKLGASTALVNTNIVGAGLLHSLSAVLKDSSVKIFIVDDSLRTQIASDEDKIKELGVQIFYWSDLAKTVSSLPKTRPAARPKLHYRDPLMYIYTSGTTGYSSCERQRGR